jgi:carbon-monoxide dehydrogenase small subunit
MMERTTTSQAFDRIDLPAFQRSIVPSLSGPKAGAALTSYQDYVVAMSPQSKVKIALVVNGEPAEVAFAPHKTLLEVLREDLGLTGTKHGCELGECGTCTVLLDGTPVLSCLVLGIACAEHSVRTVEGMAQGGKLHPLQETFADLGAAQCGYCTPAFLLAAEALLAGNLSPTRDEIKEALAGNLCRCTGYIKIYEAVELAAARMRESAHARL